jgi:hypothetical protein
MFPILREAAQVPGLLKQIYGDLARPGVAQVGKALGTVLGLGTTVLWPIALLNERAKLALETNLERYRAELDSVPPDQIQPVPPEIGVPIAEKLSYVTDEELSRLYVNLLAKASTFDTANSAHPSFINVIGNLSPDEAVLLKEFSGAATIPFVIAKLESKKHVGHFRVIGELLTGLERSVKLSFPKNIVAYVSNFDGLGLVAVNRLESIVPDSLYDELKTYYRPFVERSTFDREEWEIGFTSAKIDVTPYGRLFMGACFKKFPVGDK